MDANMKDHAPGRGVTRKGRRRSAPEERPVRYVIRRTIREFIAGGGVDAAAGLSFYSLLSILPAGVAVFSLLGLFGADRDGVELVMGIIDDIGPEGVSESVRSPLEQLADAPGAGIALAIGLGVALWSASKYVGAFSRVMNGVYDVEEGRPFWKMAPLRFLITLLVLVSWTIIVVAIVVSGGVARAIGQAVGLGDTAVLVWDIVKWPLLAALLVVVLTVLYATPNIKRARPRWLTPGAVLTIVVVAIVTAGFVLYVANFSDLEQTYGAFAGVLLFFFWLWVVNITMVFGGYLNAEIERYGQLREGIAAELVVQQPVRDTRQIIKRTARRREDVDEALRVRESSLR